MMKGAHRVTKLFGDVQHLGHLVGPIAMVVDQDIAAQNFSQRLEAQVTRRRITFVRSIPGVPLPPVTFGLNPGGPVSGHISHARRRSARLVDALWIFPASHFQPVLGTGKFHALHRSRGYDFQHHAAAAD